MGKKNLVKVLLTIKDLKELGIIKRKSKRKRNKNRKLKASANENVTNNNVRSQSDMKGYGLYGNPIVNTSTIASDTARLQNELVVKQLKDKEKVNPFDESNDVNNTRFDAIENKFDQFTNTANILVDNFNTRFDSIGYSKAFNPDDAVDVADVPGSDFFRNEGISVPEDDTPNYNSSKFELELSSGFSYADQEEEEDRLARLAFEEEEELAALEKKENDLSGAPFSSDAQEEKPPEVIYNPNMLLRSDNALYDPSKRNNISLMNKEQLRGYYQQNLGPLSDLDGLTTNNQVKTFIKSKLNDQKGKGGKLDKIQPFKKN